MVPYDRERKSMTQRSKFQGFRDSANRFRDIGHFVFFSGFEP